MSSNEPQIRTSIRAVQTAATAHYVSLKLARFMLAVSVLFLWLFLLFDCKFDLTSLPSVKMELNNSRTDEASSSSSSSSSPTLSYYICQFRRFETKSFTSSTDFFHSRISSKFTSTAGLEITANLRSFGCAYWIQSYPLCCF